MTNIFNHYFLQTNLFNFLVLLTVFIFIAIKIDVNGMITSMQNKIAQVIEEVKQNKLNSEKALNDAKASAKNLNSDIEKININAKQNAETLSNKIIEDANKQAENILSNADKVISAEEKRLADNLVKEISQVSIQKSRENIIRMLDNNFEMHEKYINESIDKLDGLTL